MITFGIATGHGIAYLVSLLWLQSTQQRGSGAGQGFDDKSPASERASCLTSFERKGRVVSTYRRTELHKAARKGRSVEVNDLLANNKYRPSDTDADGWTPLHDAAASEVTTAHEVKLPGIMPRKGVRLRHACRRHDSD